MDAGELARWTRFAAKGGIGACTALQDCVAERAGDLMFLKDDEITVLMQLGDDRFLGYCEGVVGNFAAADVRFHGRLKRPVITKRSSATPSLDPSASASSIKARSTPSNSRPSSTHAPARDNARPASIRSAGARSASLAPARTSRDSRDSPAASPPAQSPPRPASSHSAPAHDARRISLLRTRTPSPRHDSPQSTPERTPSAARLPPTPPRPPSSQVGPSPRGSLRRISALPPDRARSPSSVIQSTSSRAASPARFASPEQFASPERFASPAQSASQSRTASPVPAPIPPASASPSPSARPASLDSHYPSTLASPPRTPSPNTHAHPEDSYGDDPTRISVAMSDGEVGIGLSLLQGLVQDDDDDDGDGDDSDDDASGAGGSGHVTARTSVALEPPGTPRQASDAPAPAPTAFHPTPTSTSTSAPSAAPPAAPFNPPVAPFNPPVAPFNPPAAPTFDDPSPPPTPLSQTHRASPASLRPSEHSEDWDIYDDYRYSRVSMASRFSRFSQASHPGAPDADEPVPPVPTDGFTAERSGERDKERERRRSIDSDLSIVTQASKLAALPTTLAGVLAPPQPAPPGPRIPPPLDLSRAAHARAQPPAAAASSPLLHTTWASPLTSPEAHTASTFDTAGSGSGAGAAGTPRSPPLASGASFPGGGAASALRQALEDARDPARVRAFGQGIVVEDDEEPPAGAGSHSPASSAPSSPRMPLSPRLVVANPDERADSPPAPASFAPAPAQVLAPPPASAALSPASPPAPTPSPRLALTALATSAPRARASLFLPHPSAPAAPSSPRGPLYARAPLVLPASTLAGPSALVRAMHTALSTRPPPGARGPTVYARVETELASAIGPVPVAFFAEPQAGAGAGQAPVPVRRATTGVVGPGTGVPGTPTQVGPGPMSPGGVPPMPPTPTQAHPPPALVLATLPVGAGAGTPLARDKFVPQAGAPRPRSQSFSGFNAEVRGPPSPLTPTSPDTPVGVSRASTVSVSSPKASPRSLPSPLSIHSPGRASKPPSSPLAQTSFPPSPSRSLHQLRHVASASTLGEKPTSPLATSPLAASSFGPRSFANRVTPDSPGTPSSAQPSPDAPKTPPSDPAPHLRQSEESDHRSQTVSPTLARQSSLRSKLSLPNLRRKQSRQDSVSADGDAGAMVQVADMDFELVRPSIPHVRTSEDSVRTGRDVSVSIDVRPEFAGGFLRAASPSMSVSSGAASLPRSPTAEGAPALWQAREKDAESSMEAHRHREQRWVALMASAPAAQARKNKKVKRLLLDGVPASVRPRVWAHLTDGAARAAPGVYAQLGRRARVDAAGEIARDARAHFAEHAQLARADGPLSTLLQTYLTMCPDVRYTPGLTLIAGHLLLLTPEEDAFWVFVALMDTHLRPYFAASSVQMEVDAALFARALEANDPPVAKKVFVEMGIAPGALCAPWFTSLFAISLPVDYLHRAWDLFLYDGVTFLLRLGLALCYCCRRQVLEATSADAVLQYVQHPAASWLPPTLDGFMSLVHSVKLKDDDVRKQRVKMEAQVKRQTQSQLRGASVPGAISAPRQ